MRSPEVLPLILELKSQAERPSPITYHQRGLKASELTESHFLPTGEKMSVKEALSLPLPCRVWA